MSYSEQHNPNRRMPAEWEPHAATWIAWPHHEPDFPGKLEVVRWCYAEIVRLLAEREGVEILCHNQNVADNAGDFLKRNHVKENYRLHVVPNDRSWVRDSGPTAVCCADGIEWVRWYFNAWAKYSNYQQDQQVPSVFERISGCPLVEAKRPDNGEPMVLEGGAIDSDGQGTLLTTEECLFSKVQCRNPGFKREDYEKAFSEYLGIERTIWLGRGCAGDDTHGHVDDIARFVGPGKVVCVYEPDPADENHEPTRDNLGRLQQAEDADGRRLEVYTLPMPRAVWFEDERLPASYANFYIANGLVLVPTFNDPQDRVALNILAELFSDREVVGVGAVDLAWGFGTLHCLTQPQPTG
jgi:agmatine deiminase